MWCAVWEVYAHRPPPPTVVSTVGAAEVAASAAAAGARDGQAGGAQRFDQLHGAVHLPTPTKVLDELKDSRGDDRRPTLGLEGGALAARAHVLCARCAGRS